MKTEQDDAILITRNGAGQVLEVIRGSRRHLELVAAALRAEYLIDWHRSWSVEVA